jgi:nucleoside phosphorylase
MRQNKLNNYKIFTDLEINDINQLESALQNLFINIDSVGGRRGILRNAGIDNYFIGNLDFNLGINEFTTILVSKFKDYSVPRRNPNHPLIKLTDYILKQPQQKYNLDDENIEIFTKISSLGHKKLEAFTNNATKTRTDSFIPPEDELEYQLDEQPWYAPNFPQLEETAEEEYNSIKSEIDVVLITATNTELKAVANLLQPYPEKQKILLVYSGPETYYIGQFGSWKTVVTKCRMSSIGEGSVILATEQAQRLWNPRAIVMVGIAFGKDSKKQRIADVLVASQIISYEQQRVSEEEIVYRGSIPPSNTTLLNRFENIQNWQFTCPDGSNSRIHIGPILSGEKLVDDPIFKAKLFEQFPQAIGGEMEGAGLCAASGRVGTAWILVKSICDWGDGKKHKKHQPLAAAAAASLVHHVLSQKTVLNAVKKPSKD